MFRRLILGVSYLGDGMSFVAVAWLAIELAPQATVGLWVGGAVAAYTLPGVVGALVLGRRLRRLAVGALRRLPLWPVTVGIVIAWGVILLPFGFPCSVSRSPSRASLSAARSPRHSAHASPSAGRAL